MTQKAPAICLNALFIQDPLDGIGNYCFYLIENLIQQNPTWKLSLLVNKAAARHFRVFKDKLEILAVDISSTEGKILYMHGVFPFRALRYDLIHSIANIGLIFCPVPQIITVHDTYEYVKPDRFSGWLKRKQLILTKALSGMNADYIITDSKNTEEDMGRFYPRLRQKVRVVHLGSKFSVEPYIERGRKNFLAQGLLDVGRNLDQILEAYRSFKGKNEHKLILFGVRKDGKESSLPALLESMGLQNHVELHGRISDEELKELFQNSLAFIRAQNYDGFGLPIIEAMACGCPTLVAYNSSLVEVGGDAALFFETDSASDLAIKMNQLYDDPGLIQNLVKKGLEHARNFSWEKTTLETSNIYRQCLKENSRPC